MKSCANAKLSYLRTLVVTTIDSVATNSFALITTTTRTGEYREQSLCCIVYTPERPCTKFRELESPQLLTMTMDTM